MRKFQWNMQREICFCLAIIIVCIFLACSQNEKSQNLEIGDSAPDFTVFTLTGGQISLKDWAGSPIVLRFWDTECVYCRVDTPIFNKYFERYKDKGLRVVYLNTGATWEKVGQFVKELEIPFPVVMDEDGKVAELYRVKMVPQTIVIDPNQKIIAAILGGIAKADLDELLGKYFHE